MKLRGSACPFSYIIKGDYVDENICGLREQYESSSNEAPVPQGKSDW